MVYRNYLTDKQILYLANPTLIFLSFYKSCAKLEIDFPAFSSTRKEMHHRQELIPMYAVYNMSLTLYIF